MYMNEQLVPSALNDHVARRLVDYDITLDELVLINEFAKELEHSDGYEPADAARVAVESFLAGDLT